MMTLYLAIILILPENLILTVTVRWFSELKNEAILNGAIGLG